MRMQVEEHARAIGWDIANGNQRPDIWIGDYRHWSSSSATMSIVIVGSPAEALQALHDGANDIVEQNALLNQLPLALARCSRLVSSRERLQTLFDSSGEGFFCYEPPKPFSTALPIDEQVELILDSTLVECNAVAEELYARTGTQQVIGRRLRENINDPHGRIERGLRTFIKQGYRLHGTRTYWIDHTTGQRRSFATSVTGVVENEAFLRSWGTFREITEEDAARERAELSEMRFKSFLSVTSEAIYCFEYPNGIDTSLPLSEQTELLLDAVLTECNQAAAELYRVDHPSKVLGQRFRDFMSHDKSVYQEFFTRFIQSGYNLRLHETSAPGIGGEPQYRAVSASGELRDGKLLRVWGTSRDITQFKTAQEEVRKSEERMRSLLSKLDEVVWSISPDSSQVYFVSPNCIRILGYHDHELVGDATRWNSLVHPEDRDGIRRDFEEQPKGTSVEGTCRIVHPDNSVRWIRYRFAPVYDREGALVSIDGISSDITASRELEEQLKHSQKLEALGTLTSGIAHDFNNILAPIVGYTELAMEQSQGDQQLQRKLDVIARSAKRAQDLVRRLLTFSRRSSGPAQVQTFLLNDVIRETVTLLQNTIPASVALVWDQPEEDLWITGDAGEIQQVIMNLIVNAHQAIPGEGRISIRSFSRKSEAALDEAELEIASRSRLGRTVVLQVEDSGSGIKPSDLQRIFDPFYTTKRGSGQGTGLGLAVVNGIVRSHGGLIKVDSVLQKGTIFTVLLAAANPPSQRISAVRRTSAITKARIKAIVVDDEERVREVVSDLLRRLGVEVTSFNDPNECATALTHLPADELHLVLSDLSMPGMSGLELQEKVRSTHPESWRVIMTGLPGDALERAKEANLVQDYFVKPVTMDELGLLVSRIVDNLDHDSDEPRLPEQAEADA